MSNIEHLQHNNAKLKAAAQGYWERGLAILPFIIGSGFAAFLPKTWVSLLEEKHGKVEAVTMEVDGQLIIKPILNEIEPTK